MKKTFSILISSAGRRVELLNIWKNYCKYLKDFKLNIFTCDENPDLSPACKFSEKSFKICSCDNPNYTENLLDICKKNNIKLVIPTIDNELNLFAKNKSLFKKELIYLFISDLEFIETCQNKILTKNLFENMGLDYPKLLDNKNLTFPCFKKEIMGSSSIGTRSIFSKNQLNPEELGNNNYIFEELVDKSWSEYSIDIYYNTNHKMLSCIPRKRLSTRSGEISKGVILADKVYDYVLENFKYLKGAKGVITLQLFCDKKQTSFKCIEINPRFGGGYPMSHLAGANFPKLIIDEYLLNKKNIFSRNWEDNLLMLRYDSTTKCKIPN